jgi:hypothetical protein
MKLLHIIITIISHDLNKIIITIIIIIKVVYLLKIIKEITSLKREKLIIILIIKK